MLYDPVPFHKFVIGGYAKDQCSIGNFARQLDSVVTENPFDEDFLEYDTLDEWKEHLQLHEAPEDYHLILEELWYEYERKIPSERRL